MTFFPIPKFKNVPDTVYKAVVWTIWRVYCCFSNIRVALRVIHGIHKPTKMAIYVIYSNLEPCVKENTEEIRRNYRFYRSCEVEHGPIKSIKQNALVIWLITGLDTFRYHPIVLLISNYTIYSSSLYFRKQHPD